MGNKSALQLEVEKEMGFEIDEDLFAYLEHYARRKLEVANKWVKRNRKSPSWFWGLGNWTRANAEICLLATKGKPKRAPASVHSIIDAPIGRHSEKPAETRDRIAQLAGGGSMIELFARKTAPGWDSWGDEVEGGETE